MIEIAARKFFGLIFSLWILVSLTFLCLLALPGSPFSEERSLHPLVLKNLEGHWAPEASVFIKYTSYLEGVFTGYLGPSLSQPGLSVGDIVARDFQASFWLNATALTVSGLFGLGVALMLSLWRSDAANRFFFRLSSVLLSLPALFLAPALIYVFAISLRIFPVAKLETPSAAVLPLVALCLRPICQLARFLLIRLLDNEQQVFIRAAQAKGLGWRRIVLIHLLKVSLIPFILYSVPTMVSLLSGSFLVEVLFAIRGTGSQFVEALALRDYPLILGITLVYGFFMIVLSQLAEFAVLFLDPRERDQWVSTPRGWTV